MSCTLIGQSSLAHRLVADPALLLMLWHVGLTSSGSTYSAELYHAAVFNHFTCLTHIRTFGKVIFVICISINGWLWARLQSITCGGLH